MRLYRMDNNGRTVHFMDWPLIVWKGGDGGVCRDGKLFAQGAGTYILHLNVKRDVPIIVIMVLKLA